VVGSVKHEVRSLVEQGLQLLIFLYFYFKIGLVYHPWKAQVFAVPRPKL